MVIRHLVMAALLLQAELGLALGRAPAPRAAGAVCDSARFIAADARWHARLLALSTDLLESGKRLPPAGLPGALPANPVRVMAQAIRMDLVRRTVYASCDGVWLWVLDSGGLVNADRWYGPLRSMAHLPPPA